MAREFSAGGVVLHFQASGWNVAVIEPRRDPEVDKNSPSKRNVTPVLALPKGLVDQGEKAEQTAIREVREETGVEATLVTKLADIRYFYVRSWGDKQRVFKIVSFFLLLYRSGQIGEISEEMRIEVERALWMPLEEAAERLSYKGEREMVKKAQEYLRAHPELQGSKAEPRRARERA
ncbi:MAG TPA: NUDIX domain-containing protein [Terriglobales bacterium]|nr:NUDIX domain-containing protein [Terriglobales bacterium]